LSMVELELEMQGSSLVFT